MEKKHGSVLIKNSLFDLVNNGFTFATGWIISIWVARQLGPNNYGIFCLILWLSSTFSWVIGMGLIHAITKYIAEYRGKKDTDVLGPIVMFVLKIEIVLSISVTVILLFLRSYIADYFFTPSESFLFFLSFIGILPGMITAIFSATIEGIQKFEYFTYANLFITPFSFISKIVVLFLDKGIEGLLIVMFFFSIVNMVFYYFVLKKENIHILKNILPLRKDLKKRIKKFNLSVIAIILCDKIIWDKSENFFLGRLCSASEVGFYNLGFNISKKFTSILPSTFWRVLFPAMSSYSGTGEEKKMKRLFFITTRYLAFFSFPMGVGGAILSYQIVYYFYGPDFINAYQILQILFLSSIITSLCQPGAAVLYGYEKQSFIYKLGIIMAVVNIFLDIFLIKKFGATGAAVCYAITTVIGAVIGTIYTCHIMKLEYPFYSIAKVFLSTLIMGAVMEMIILWNDEIVGFILSILCGGSVYLTCSFIFGTFKKEDCTLLEGIEKIMPGKIKYPFTFVLKSIATAKNKNITKSSVLHRRR